MNSGNKVYIIFEGNIHAGIIKQDIIPSNDEPVEDYVITKLNHKWIHEVIRSINKIFLNPEDAFKSIKVIEMKS